VPPRMNPHTLWRTVEISGIQSVRCCGTANACKRQHHKDYYTQQYSGIHFVPFTRSLTKYPE
jgi:hypothetical protein